MSDVIELLQRFQAGANLVKSALDGLSEPEIDYRPEATAWSVRQIAAHLADSEVVAGWRFRRLIADADPQLEAFDEKLWAGHLGYERRDLWKSLESFLRLRAENYDMLMGLTPEYFENSGVHSERGRLTLRDMLRINVEHAERHAGQIERVRTHFRNSASD